MNHLSSINDHNSNDSDSSDGGYDDDDDFITFQFNLKPINIYYSQFSKYSKVVRNNYLVTDVRNLFPQKLQDFQSQNRVDTDSIFYLFQLLRNDFNFDENLNLTYERYTDLFKLSEFLEIKKLTKKLKKYLKNHEDDCNFIIQIISYEMKSQENDKNSQFQIKQQMEDVLASKINDCFQNEKFSELPISIIHRAVEKSDKKQISSDLLFEFIAKSIDKFCFLLTFLDLKGLSEKNLHELYKMYSKDSNKIHFDYLKCNLHYIIELVEKKNNLQNQLDDSEQEKNQLDMKEKKLQNQLNDSEQEKIRLQTNINKLESEKKQLIDQLNDSEQDKNRLQTSVNQLELEKKKLQNQISDFKQEKSNLQEQLNGIEQERNQLKKKIDEIELEKSKISGVIEAKVRDDLFINAEIKLIEKGIPLDKTRSKYIISPSKDKVIGERSYVDGEPITSLNQNTKEFIKKAGTYYIHAYVVDYDGKSKELISNPITISKSSFEFESEGKSREIVLPKGKYLLEVWGAQGGNSVGSGTRSAGGNGGLGGYSKGLLTLSSQTKIFIYVGSQGQSANSADGSVTNGGFPDGGGTKTGHYDSYTSVPGTGGGSTSIRISSDSLYSRVIVAGGGGGAGGDNQRTDHGGFGGGTTGGNSYCKGSLQDQGAGTQTNSSPGPKGSGPPGVAGTFGQGATGLYKQGRDSGGGGGGGWFGGGSGGYGGDTNCASGGGGSGWIFTESSYNVWKSGDSSNASQFKLDKSFYLEDASTVPGNASFPSPNGKSSETGHSGSGYAKITPI